MPMYVDKEEFHNQLKEYRDTGSAASYEAIGKYFLDIARNVLNKPCYINYSKDWKDDMVSEAVYDMVRYIHNYDVDKMDNKRRITGEIPNPFSYFSRYAFNGISRYIGYKGKDKDVIVRLNFIENMD